MLPVPEGELHGEEKAFTATWYPEPGALYIERNILHGATVVNHKRTERLNPERGKVEMCTQYAQCMASLLSF